MSARLFIANPSPDTTGDDLYTFFSKAGEVKSCQLITDRRTGRSRGFCFIEMTSIVSASMAKKQFKGKSLDGHILRVEDARPHKVLGN